LTVRESEAAEIRTCARKALAGHSLREIAIGLNKRQVPSAQGGTWSPQALRRMLLSARIGGMREHRGEVAAEAAWPAIVTPAESAQLRAMLTDERRRTNRSVRRYLLARLLRCGKCGQTLVSRPTATGTRCYVCAKGPGSGGCGGLSVRAEPLELWVVDAVLYRLDSAEMVEALAGSSEDPDAERLRLELEEAQAQLAELAADWGARAITRQEWLAARRPIEERLQSAQKRLARLSRTSAVSEYLGNADALRERWDGLQLSGQHAVVAAVLDHLVVRPARRGFNGFDASRFDPVWRV
jgi:hypothetical protein